MIVSGSLNPKSSDDSIWRGDQIDRAWAVQTIVPQTHQFGERSC